MRYLFIVALLIIRISCIEATEIYGILDEDTIIGPDGNPWYVTHNLIVNEDATLTILPGTEISVTAAYTDDYYNFVADNSGEAEAKVITIYGKILAIGTEADSIFFTRNPDYPDYRWGGIRILSENPENSKFKHCEIKYTAYVNDNIGVSSYGINSQPGISIQYCYLQDNYRGIRIFEYENELYYPTNIYNCSFLDTNDRILFHGYDEDLAIRLCIENASNITQIFSCDFNSAGIDLLSGTNDIINCTFSNITQQFGFRISNNHDFYGNEVINLTSSSLNDVGSSWTDKGVFRKNYIHRVNCGYAMELELTDCEEVSDNHFSDLNIDMYMMPDSRFYNNTSENSGMTIMCNFDSAGTQNIYNNFMYESSISGDITIGDYNYFNNILFGDDVGIIFHLDGGVFNGYNNYTDKWSLCAILYEGDDTNYYNNIFNDVAGFIENNFYRYNRNFYNNFLTYNIPDFITDCGGNLEDMDIALAGVIIDTLNHTFALSDSSLCIDAGYEGTTFCNWDYNYNYSPFDGDGDGVAVVDIGPVEYGSYFTIGYVKCTVSDLDSVPLDIIRGEVAGECVEYTGLDGSFVMGLPEGTYTLNLTSPFYENDSLFVAVNVADTSFVNMSLEATYPFVEADEDELLVVELISDVVAYPNPFNPEVTISFSTTEGTGNTEISIFNIKGQRLRTFKIQNSSFKINQVVWDGTDEYGNRASTGVYLFRIKAGNNEQAGKILMLK
ncbi:MAG: T9SS type A sorting domain-containing protein [Candidatus Stygibacter australis]|nr:T9SS type A sorting domain-containing protein [Candidatus Stygibacter australis]